MKSIVTFAAAIAAVVAAAAADATTNAVTNATRRARRQLTPEQLAARAERDRQRMAGGGIVRKAGSAKGVFVILNAQGRVAERDLSPVVGNIDRTLAVQVSMSKAEGVSPASIAAKLKEAGAAAGVGVVDDASLPTLLVAPETGWAIVNVAALGEKCAGTDTLAARVRKEVLRALAFTTGCAYMTVADPLMRDVVKPGDVDALRSEEFGFEIRNRFNESAPLYGLKPWRQATYDEACQEGWAPAPTNSYQRWRWKKTHALPSNPMKIEFDPKTGK